MVVRMLFLAARSPLSPHPPDSDLAEEESQMLWRLAQGPGGPVSAFSFCPCWPFCK